MKFTPLEIEKIESLAKVYLQAKSLILYTEEVDPNSKFNLQIIKELRDAFDHLMHVFYYKLGKDESNINHIDHNLEKAIGHVFRAAFDALDGTVISLQQRIAEELTSYPLEVIREVVPDYWDIKKEVFRLAEQVASHREEKTVREKDTARAINNYVKDVDNLKNIYLKILEAGPLLEECLKNNKNEKRRKYLRGLSAGFIIAIFSFLLTVWYNSCDLNTERPSLPVKKSIAQDSTTNNPK